MSRLRWTALLAVSFVLGACRSPQDPSSAPLSIDGGGPTTPPEVQPDTGHPIGPVAAGDGLQSPPAQTGGVGGQPGITSGGSAGSGAMAGGSTRPVIGQGDRERQDLILAERR
jgi:hypothetical protein